MQMKRNKVKTHFLFFSVFTSLIFIFSFFSCSPQKQLYSQQQMVMGVVNEISIIHSNATQAEKILQESFKLLKKLDHLMSHYKQESEISRLNREAYTVPVKVSKHTFDLIEIAYENYLDSGGAFDISVFPLMKLWGFYEGNPRLPSEEDVSQTLLKVGMDSLQMNAGSQSIIYLKEDLEIELGSLAKGYACDKIVGLLKSQKVKSAFVNVGGSIRAFGKNLENKNWQAQIRHPRKLEVLELMVKLDDRSISTSGDYEQFFEVEGKRYGHILNPLTGYPDSKSVSVTVIAPTALESDVLSTTVYLLGPEKGKVWTRKLKGVEVVHFYKDENGSIGLVRY